MDGGFIVELSFELLFELSFELLFELSFTVVVDAGFPEASIVDVMFPEASVEDEDDENNENGSKFGENKSLIFVVPSNNDKFILFIYKVCFSNTYYNIIIN
jgi:hypothetical protein